MGERGAADGRRGQTPEILVVAALVILGAGFFHLVGVGCPIKFVTGVSCPGCGMTRAWLEALQGNLDVALAYHPLFWSVPVVLVLGCVPSLETNRAAQVVLAAFIVAFIALWAWRMAVPHDTAILVDAGVFDDVVNMGVPGWMSLFG